ncbi:hypothetical protein ACGFK1_18735 [Mycobacterium sp. NPDC048908]|uniref:hypothetical protein n=1 Tax=Mycobacterium sp. NPDC048908 TaxID=3364292 RepID=UPI003719F11C
MAMGSTTWFFNSMSSVARVDLVDGNPVWTGPADIGEVFPALLSIGLNRDRYPGFGNLKVGSITAVQQTAVNEAVFDIGIRLFLDGMQMDIDRNVRLDLATGKVLEYPASFGTTFKAEGWREYRIWDKSAWKILNTITRQFIVEQNWADPVFTLPNGQRTGLPADGTTMGIDRGKLYVRTPDTAGSYRVFDLDNLTTDGTVKGARTDVTGPPGFDPMFTMFTDPDAWRARRPAPEFDRALLTAINSAAHDAGTDTDVLLRVLYAESGLRTTAYHPAGRYGLLQLNAEQLTAAGWAKTPQEYLDAGAEQLPVIATHLKSLGLPSETDEAGLWLCYMLGRMYTEDDLAAPVAAPDGPRPELWSSHAVADFDGDGVLSVEDVRYYIGSIRNDARFEEIRKRIGRLSAIIPDWPNFQEIMQGDDMGMVHPSAASLGLLVDITWDQNNPAYDDRQVESIDPPPGTLQLLVDPVRVTINSVGL